MSTRKLSTLALLSVLAIAIYSIESLLPPPAPIPGVKLGLSNIIILITLKKYGPKETALVLSVKILLQAFLFGQLMSLLYSAAGGLFCLAAEYLCNRFLKGHFLPVTSIIGALFHNIGQTLIACLLTESLAVISYVPILIISGTITGLFVGLTALFADSRIKLSDRLI